MQANASGTLVDALSAVSADTVSVGKQLEYESWNVNWNGILEQPTEPPQPEATL